jgi:hypothetical protein
MRCSDMTSTPWRSSSSPSGPVHIWTASTLSLDAWLAAWTRLIASEEVIVEK